MNFWFIIGILMIISSISFIYHYRINRISKQQFKGKVKLYIISAAFLLLGVLFAIIGIIQLAT